ncbi:MAG: acyl-CoA dehydrogenase family protein [Acidobacteriota bacterium]|nr:acyl-CoA dehydrogenase family protein [Blastocatellia bacterium]MDW8241075.1 acyl-CoA dehydrogenase family protein [Acidobacteriota bacterium]
MDFRIDEKIRAMTQDIRQFMQAEVYPLERPLVEKGFGQLLPTLHALRQRVKEQGWWAPFLPKQYGGVGLTLREFAHVSEELGRSPLGHFLFNCQAPDVGNMELLMQFGTEEQKETYLMPLARGEIRSCFAMTEPDYPGSNPVWMGTTAVKDGDHYVINGRKWFTSAADGATFAIVMAITNPEAERPHKRASQILVPLNTPGYRLVRNVSVMGETGQDWLTHGEVEFQNCRVPQTNRLGPEGDGFVLAQERLGPGRIHHCMRWIGICERAFELMCQHAARRQLAPGKPLGSRQIIQQWIAECRAEINAARLMVLQAAWKIDHEGARAARDEISLIKFYVAGVLQRVLDRAIQVHGGLGVTDDLPLAFWYRHERAARIYDGADEVHKASVARRILRTYGVEVG